MPLDKINELYEDDDYVECLKRIEELPDECCVFKNTLKGNIYSSAEKKLHGFKSDYKKAAQFYKIAAESGGVEAMIELSQAHYYGDGVKESYSKVYDYLKEATIKDFDEAAREFISFLYDHPEYGEIGECAEVCERFCESEPSCCGNALVKLGRMYIRGSHGVHKNVCKAIGYFNRGRVLNHQNAIMDLAFLYAQGREVEKDLNLAEELAKKCSNHIMYEDIMELLEQNKRNKKRSDPI